MNALIEELESIRNANALLIDVVCDQDLGIQGLMIIERIQIQLLVRQSKLLLAIRQRVKYYESNISRGIH